MTIGRRIVVSSGFNLIQEAIAFVSGIIVARLMGPYAIGTISAAMAILSMFRFVGDLGLGTSHVKHLSTGKDIGPCMGVFVPLDAVLSVLAVLIGLGAYAIRNNTPDIPSQIPLSVMLIVALGYLMIQFTAIPRATFLGLQNVVKRDAPRVMSQFVASALRILAAVLGFGALGLAWADAISYTFLVGIYIWLLRGIPISRPKISLLKSYLSFGTVIFFSGVLISLAEPLDKVLLQMHYDLALVGIYSSAHRLASPLSITVSMTAAWFFPALSQLKSQKGTKGVSSFLVRSDRRMSLAATSIGIAGVAIAQSFVNLVLGEQYTAAGPVFALLILQGVIQIIGYPYLILTAALEKNLVYFLTTAVTLGLQSFLLFAVIRNWGGVSDLFGGPLVSTASALVVAAILRMLIYRWVAARTVGVNPNWRSVLHLFSVGFCSLLVVLVFQVFGNSNILISVLVGITAVLLHIGLLWGAGEADKEDLAFFWDTFSPAKVRKLLLQAIAR